MIQDSVLQKVEMLQAVEFWLFGFLSKKTLFTDFKYL